ncbi:RibD family protein [Phaeovibrio sulfidiphilus]|uniref:RibD family protein n=1 Tax=Phaeovibrio sulfidiphilus TaxID=1220600 RepID=A0A8J7CPX5_9PROT|nr:RibD family protein [Phaeovibrio sulfidiphilus]MBE1237577.1 RibD family protein [Phaeovibrio sulfidiphilus]
MKKPYVIIHTLTSLEGKINSIAVPEFRSAARQYEQLALHPDTQIFNIRGYLNGRVTTDDNTTFYRPPDLRLDAAPVPEGDFIAEPDAAMYYVSIDPNGRLGWQDTVVDYGGVRAHVISVLTEKAGNAYRDMLRRHGISYIIAGEERLDNALVLHKLYTLFGMDRVMIGGGGVLNWSFLQAGLVDEVSVLLAPIADGSPDSPRLFQAREPYCSVGPRSFTLIEARPLEDSSLWLRYRVNPAPAA